MRRRKLYLESGKDDRVSIPVSLDLNPTATNFMLKIGAKPLLDLPIAHVSGEASDIESVLLGKARLLVFIVVIIITVVVARDQGKRSCGSKAGRGRLLLHDDIIGRSVEGSDSTFGDLRECVGSGWDEKKS